MRSTRWSVPSFDPGPLISLSFQVRASIGCKIDAQNLEEAVAGSPLFVLRPDEDAEPYKAKVSHALTSLKGMVDKGGHGVYVMASTLGSMEALLTYLKEDCEIPVCGIRIGPVHKKDVIRASVMLEHKKVLPSSLASLSILHLHLLPPPCL